MWIRVAYQFVLLSEIGAKNETNYDMSYTL